MASYFLRRKDDWLEQWTSFRENHHYLDASISYIAYWLPPVNYITVHYTYFLTTTFLSSLIFYYSSPNPTSAPIAGSDTLFNTTTISYVDSLFMVTSAVTNTGLNTINLGSHVLTTWQQVVLWILMIIGSPIWISLWTVLARKRAFEHRFEAIVRQEREMKRQKRLRTKGRLGRAANLARVAADVGGTRKKKTMADVVAESATTKTNHHQRRNKLGWPSLERVVQPREDGQEMAALQAPPTMDREDTLVASSDPKSQEETHPPLSSGLTTKVNTNTNTNTNTNGQPTLAPLWTSHSATRPTSRQDLPISPPDHISILLPTDSRDTAATTRPPISPNPSETSSLDVTDFLFHWDQILTKNKVSHNSQFHGLTSEQRETIGGCEYRALKILALTVPLYFILWQLLCAIALGAWMSQHGTSRSENVGANPWWAGIFLSVSAFNNGGLALFSDSLISFGESYFVLVTVGALILAGNTAYPILLRFLFWSTLKILEWFKRNDEDYAVWRETLGFMLKYPRRVYTTMFPAQATWWLACVLIIINSVDWVLFEVLNIGNEELEQYPIGQRIMDGWFQSISVRAAGLIVFPLGSLYISMQVVQLIMMYISVYPVVITMRSSNVYEERSLGIYADESSETLAEPEEPSQTLQPIYEGTTTTNNTAQAARLPTSATTVRSAHSRFSNHNNNNPYIIQSPSTPNQGQFLRRRKTTAIIQAGAKRAFTFHGVGVPPPKPPNQPPAPTSFITQQIRGQLAHDLWWLVLAILLLVIIETPNFNSNPTAYSVFNIIFESVSAYGCVGLSIGFPGIDPSFAGAMRNGSKVVLVGVMLRGRHRGLPVAVDRAVRLPGEEEVKGEEREGVVRRVWSERRSLERVVSGQR